MLREFLKRWSISHLFTWLGLMSHEGRRAWAFLSMLMGCGLMTSFAAIAMLLLRQDAAYVFWLGLAAHAQVFVALTGFTAFFIKRDIEITKTSASIKDKPDGTEERKVDVQRTDK